MWSLTEWSLNSVHGTISFDFGQLVSKSSVSSIVAQETIVKELEQGVVFVALHNGQSSDFMWRVDVVGKLSEMIPQS